MNEVKTKTIPTPGHMGYWLVMDGRARLDVDEAVVLEAMYRGRRDQPPRKAARRSWKDQDAVLCFAKDNPDGTCGPAEYICDVDPVKAGTNG